MPDVLATQTERVFNLLTEPYVRVRDAEGAERSLTLPGVLARLGATDVRAFLGLQAHQTHAWHAFLVQLAAIALHRANVANPAQAEDRWAELLRTLTLGRDEPWCLVVPDLAQPAFLQPPVPEESLVDFKAPSVQPDGIDILVTSKNHDVKGARIHAPRPEHWMYALVSLQTMQGYSGRHPPDRFYYGIARMNGGFGNRPGVGFSPGFSYGARFRRDLKLLLSNRKDIVDGEHGFQADGKALLWMQPWDGKHSLNLSECDPFFIEVCRRIRLIDIDGSRWIGARLTASNVPRLASKEAKGNLGDPWTPVNRAEGTALTVGSSGLSYDLVQQLLLGENFRSGAAGRLEGEDGSGTLFTAVALVRGSGETNGLHERWLPVPSKIRVRLGTEGERDRLAVLARQRVRCAQAVRQNVLRPALLALLQCEGSLKKLNHRDDRPSLWTAHLDRAVDRVFFEQLWTDADLDGETADARWATTLRRLARDELDAAIASAPLPSARRYRAVAAAERVFEGQWDEYFGEFESP